MDLVTKVCADLDFPRARVHSERFLSLSGDPFSAGPTTAEVDEPPGTDLDPDRGPDVVVTVELDGQRRSVPWRRTEKLLDALLGAGLDAPYSCREGACSACVCSLVSGEVRLARNEVLNDDDVADGYILACQAQPVSDEIVIEY